MKNLNIDAMFPDKLGFLFQPSRYKVIYGGRGGGRSWGCARALLLKSVVEPIRVLCAREVQKSIRDSVHKLLSDQIQVLGISPLFEIQEAVIKVKNDSEFTFAGLSTQTIESIKSMEGVDYVWAEEAHIITKRSWDILIPTIRKNDSEIWITFNPSLESDETFQRFIVNPPPDTQICKLNYHDNPWFPEVLEKERLYCKENDPENYPNIWEGECKPAAEGAIYYHEIHKAINEGRICNVPYDPMLRVHIILDLGWNDAMAISLVQRQASALRIIEYIEDSHKTLDYYSAMLKEKRLNWGKAWPPHDGYSRDIKTGQSTAEIMTKLGWDVAKRNEITELNVEDGIRATRMAFGRVYFDINKTERLIECLKRYRRRINIATQEAGAPFHDEFSHGADNFRYICINAEKMQNEDVRYRPYHVGYSALDPVVGY